MIGVVPHEKVRVKAWQDRVAHKFPTLADAGYHVPATYGVAFQCRIHTDTSNTPATFLIDKHGVLRWAHVAQGAKNFGDRPSVDEVLDKVREIGGGE